MPTRRNRLRTGIDVLDRQLGGGLPAGSVVAFTAPPASQAELFLYQLTAARNTLYLSADRTEDAVVDALNATPAPTGNPTVRYVPGDAPLEHARRLFRNVGEDAGLIVDPVDPLERRDRARYRNFVNDLQNHMQNTGGLAVLHALSGRETDARDITEHMADVVFDLTVQRDGDDVESRLAVMKFRGGRAPAETIKLELGERVQIDTSRDIA